MLHLRQYWLSLCLSSRNKIKGHQSRVVRGDINFWILTQPLNFQPPIDQNRPCWTKFLIENWPRLMYLEKNWTKRPSTLKAFLGYLSWWKGVWNVSGMCLELTGSLWRFQKKPIDQKWDHLFSVNTQLTRDSVRLVQPKGLVFTPSM